MLREDRVGAGGGRDADGDLVFEAGGLAPQQRDGAAHLQWCACKLWVGSECGGATVPEAWCARAALPRLSRFSHAALARSCPTPSDTITPTPPTPTTQPTPCALLACTYDACTMPPSITTSCSLSTKLATAASKSTPRRHCRQPGRRSERRAMSVTSATCSPCRVPPCRRRPRSCSANPMKVGGTNRPRPASAGGAGEGGGAGDGRARAQGK